MPKRVSDRESIDRLRMWNRTLLAVLDRNVDVVNDESASSQRAAQRTRLESGGVVEHVLDAVEPAERVVAIASGEAQQAARELNFDADPASPGAKIRGVDAVEPPEVSLRELRRQVAEGAAEIAPPPDFFDVAPVAAALLDGEIGDVVVGLRVFGCHTIFTDPQRFEFAPNSRAPPIPLGALELVLLAPSETFFRVVHTEVPILPFLATLLASGKVRKYLFNARSVYSLLFAFLGTERLTIENVCDISVGAGFVFPASVAASGSFARLAFECFREIPPPGPDASPNTHFKWQMTVCRHMGRRVDDVVLCGISSKAAQLDVRAEFLCAQMTYHGFVVDHVRWVAAVRKVDEQLQQLAEAITSATSSVDPKFDPFELDAEAISSFLLVKMGLASQLSEADAIAVQRGTVSALDALAANGVELARHIATARVILSQRATLFQTFNRYAAPTRRGERLNSDASQPPQYTVHPHFTVRGTKTGRIFASNPNLQNLPKASINVGIGGGDGVAADEVRIRSLFVAPPGCTLLAIDFNQIELRVLAHLSGDEALRAEFNAGGDVLRRMGRLIFDRATDAEVTDAERSATKVVVYGLIYGLGDAAMQVMLAPGVVAAKVRSEFFVKFPGVASFLDDVKSHASFRQEAFTVLGRRRSLHECAGDALKAQRLAVSTMVQGTAAELLKCAMWDAHVLRSSLRNDAARASLASAFALLLTVHDELVFAVRSELVGDVAKLLSAVVIESAVQLGLAVPVTLTCKVGPSLGELVSLNHNTQT